MKKLLVLLLILSSCCRDRSEMIIPEPVQTTFGFETKLSNGVELDGIYLALYDYRDHLAFSEKQVKDGHNFGKINTNISSGRYRVYCVGYINHGSHWEKPFSFNLMEGTAFSNLKITTSNTEMFEYNEFIDIEPDEKYHLVLKRITSKLNFDISSHEAHIRSFNIKSNVDYMPGRTPRFLSYITSHFMYDLTIPLPELDSTHILADRAHLSADIVVMGGKNIKINMSVYDIEPNHQYNLYYISRTTNLTKTKMD